MGVSVTDAIVSKNPTIRFSPMQCNLPLEWLVDIMFQNKTDQLIYLSNIPYWPPPFICSCNSNFYWTWAFWPGENQPQSVNTSSLCAPVKSHSQADQDFREYQMQGKGLKNCVCCLQFLPFCVDRSRGQKTLLVRAWGGELSFSNLRNQPVRRLIGHLAVVPFLPSVVSAVGWQPKGWQEQQEQEQALS